MKSSPEDLGTLHLHGRWMQLSTYCSFYTASMGELSRSGGASGCLYRKDEHKLIRPLDNGFPAVLLYSANVVEERPKFHKQGLHSAMQTSMIYNIYI